MGAGAGGGAGVGAGAATATATAADDQPKTRGHAEAAATATATATATDDQAMTRGHAAPAWACGRRVGGCLPVAVAPDMLLPPLGDRYSLESRFPLELLPRVCQFFGGRCGHAVLQR